MLTSNKFIYGIVGLMLLVGIIAYPNLPDQVPIHWGIDGQPDRWGDRLFAVLGLPAIVLFLNVALRTRAPALIKGEQSSETLQFTINLTSVLLGYVHILVLLSALGVEIDLTRAVLPALGTLLFLTGNVMGRLEPNWLIGFRTWWTVNNPEVWRRTNRIAARWMVFVGVVIILAGLFAPLQLALILTLVLLLGGSAALLIYSYRLHRQLTTSP